MTRKRFVNSLFSFEHVSLLKERYVKTSMNEMFTSQSSFRNFHIRRLGQSHLVLVKLSLSNFGRSLVQTYTQ